MSQDPNDVIDPAAPEHQPTEITDPDSPDYVDPADGAEPHDRPVGFGDDDVPASGYVDEDQAEPDPHENPADQMAKAAAIEAEQERDSALAEGAGGPDE